MGLLDPVLAGGFVGPLDTVVMKSLDLTRVGGGGVVVAEVVSEGVGGSGEESRPIALLSSVGLPKLERTCSRFALSALKFFKLLATGFCNKYCEKRDQ